LIVPKPHREKKMRIITYIFLLIILIVGVTFACLNAEPVTINYYVGKHSLALSLLLALVFAIGAILGLIVGSVVLLKQKTKNIHLHNRLKLAEKELANLRTIPLKDNH